MRIKNDPIYASDALAFAVYRWRRTRNVTYMGRWFRRVELLAKMVKVLNLRTRIYDAIGTSGH